MAHGYRNYSPEQGYLLAPDPLDWLPEDSLAYQVRDIVRELDLTLLHSAYSQDGRGAPAFAPQMMIALLLYGHYKGVPSARGIKRLCIEDLGARFLCAGEPPDHRSISLFRTRHAEAIRNLFQQSVLLCQSAGMVSLMRTAVDGTKIAGAASKDSSMTYQRITQSEIQLAAEVDALVQSSVDLDAAEDARFGAEHDGFSLPEHLQSRKNRLAALRKAKEELEARAREKETARKKEWDQTVPKDRPHRKTPDPETAQPEANDRYNFVDPESRLMKGRHQYVQGYNAQACVDTDHQVIVGCAVTNECTDHAQLVPMAQQTTQNLGRPSEQVLADAGYFSYRNIALLEQQGYSLLIPPDNQWSHDDRIADPLTDAQQQELSVRDRMSHQLLTQQGRFDYQHRLKTIEPVFGQIKCSPGHELFTRFLRRGLALADQDWCFVCAAHNFRKLLRFRKTQLATSLQTTPVVCTVA